MAGLLLPDLSVQVSQRRWRYILDPRLALTRFGASFAHRLAPYAELWLAPEFFNILESAALYRREPELLAWPDTGRAAADEMREALFAWSNLRDESGYIGGSFNWVGDALRESSLPPGFDESIVSRWEAATRALDGRLPQKPELSGPIVAATRDAVALCAVLQASSILTVRPATSESPRICGSLQAWGIPCRRIVHLDSLAAIEREAFLRLLVQAGVAQFAWAGFDLAVVHVLLPDLARLDASMRSMCDDDELLPDDDGHPISAPSSAPWDDAQVFWFDVYRGDGDAA